MFLALNTYLCVSIILVIMKKRVLLWMAGLVFAVTSLFAQDIPVGVVVAFKKGNSQEPEQVFGREGESGDSESLGECRQAGS